LEQQGFVSKVHRKKPHFKLTPEHLFSDQKSQTGFFIRTVGIIRVTMRIGLANIVYKYAPFSLVEDDWCERREVLCSNLSF